MTASAAMSLVLEVACLSLTPWERWSAARGLTGGPQSMRLAVIFLSIALAVLLVLFSVASIQRGKRERKAARGFINERAEANGSAEGSRKAATRNIPVGKSLYVTRRKSGNVDIKATVKRNSDAELAVTLSEAVNVVFGETWCVRYYSGTSVWQFDTKALGYNGNTLSLSHSEDVRFVNRRRFLRAPARLRAFVAHFPFMICDDDNAVSGLDWAPPRFFPGVVMEIAGPGLRIESEMKVEAGERVLVVLNLPGQLSEAAAGWRARASGTRVVEGAGQVRYVKAIERGFSIAIELTDLEDCEVDELIRFTNAASFEASELSKEPALLVGRGA